MSAKKTKTTKKRVMPMELDEFLAARFSPEELAESERIANQELALMRLRQHFGVTQAELSAVTGMTQGAVSRFERARDMKLSTLRAYMEGLGVELVLFARAGETLIPIGLPEQPRTRRRKTGTA